MQALSLKCVLKQKKNLNKDLKMFTRYVDIFIVMCFVLFDNMLHLA